MHGISCVWRRAEHGMRFVGSPVALVVPNLAEFNLSQVGTELGPSASELGPLAIGDFHCVGQAYGDQSLFWTHEERVLVLAPGLDRQWLTDVCAALGDATPPVITPPRHGGGLVGDLLMDAQAMTELRAALGPPRQVDLLCWGASRELYALIATVRSWGHEVRPEVPDHDRYWTTRYLDSKLCCLDMRTSMPDLAGPRTWIVSSQAELAGIVERLLASAGAAVIKSPCGVGGDGLHLARADGEGIAGLWRAVDRSWFLRRFPLLVQEVVATTPAIDTPSVDLLIGSDGIGSAVTNVTGSGGRQLLALGAKTGLLPEAIEDEAHGVARRIAAEAAGLGYRGWLGVDFLAGLDGRLYLLEFNARRTGGIHAAALLERRSGTGTAIACVADDVAVASQATYAGLRAPFLAAWDSHEQVYPSTVRRLGRSPASLGLVALAADAAGAEHLLSEVTTALRTQD